MQLQERNVIRQIEHLYIPENERELRRIQRRVEELDREVRAWSQTVIGVLPKGLALLREEIRILHLFLAQQRRLNLELDTREPADPPLRSRIGRILPFLADGDGGAESVYAVHRIVATHLESEIERACDLFCQSQNVPPVCDPAIDWRVAIRYLAQGMHNIARQIDIVREYETSPKRFELALLARDGATEIAGRRRAMLDAFVPEPVH